MQELHCGIDMIDWSVTFAELDGAFNRDGNKAFCPLNCSFQRIPLSEKCGDCCREGTARAMSIDRVNAG